MNTERVATVRRLVLAKRLLSYAEEMAHRSHSYGDRVVATVQTGLAVEILLDAIVREVESQPVLVRGTRGYMGGPPSDEAARKFRADYPHGFAQLYNQAVATLRENERLGENQPLYSIPSLQRLRKHRNSAQHDAIAPTEVDFIEMSSTAREFANRLLSLGFFECCNSLETVSLSILLDDRVLKTYVVEAEKALSQRHLRCSSQLIYVAFLFGRLKRRFDWWKERQGHQILDDFDRGNAIQDLWFQNKGVPAGRDRMTDLMTEMVREVSRLPELHDNYILGLDQRERNRLRSVTPRFEQRLPKSLPTPDEILVTYLPRWLEGENSTWAGPVFGQEPSYEECSWACDYVVDTLIKWQLEERGQHTEIPETYIGLIPKLKAFC